MNVAIIAVPYDSGRRGYRMGAGPEALLAGGMAEQLRRSGHHVSTAVVEAPDGLEHDPVASAFALAARIEVAVREARAAGSFPVILAGNCIHTLGAVAGVNGSDLGLVWFDAHGDINTPETSTSGFLDGMSVATMLGWCHATESARLHGFTPLDASRVLFVGTRDLDPPEAAAAARSGLAMLAPAEASGPPLERALDAFASNAQRAYVHIDLDVLDPAAHGPANQFAAPGGLSAGRLLEAVRAVSECCTLAGVTLSAYDPAGDEAGTVRAAAITLAVAVLAPPGPAPPD